VLVSLLASAVGFGVVQAEHGVGAGAAGPDGLDGEVGEQGLVGIVPGKGPPVAAVGVLTSSRAEVLVPVGLRKNRTF
jgi:hypothetical protein